MFTLNKNNILTLGSILIAAGFITTAWFSQASAVSAPGPVPFGGRLATVTLCCNGTMFSMTPEKEVSSPAHPGVLPNSFILEKPKEIPIPEIGIGLYRWWAIIPANGVLGDALPGGVCLNPKTDCSPIPVIWNVNKMGTTLIPGP